MTKEKQSSTIKRDSAVKTTTSTKGKTMKKKSTTANKETVVKSETEAPAPAPNTGRTMNPKTCENVKITMYNERLKFLIKIGKFMEFGPDDKDGIPEMPEDFEENIESNPVYILWSEMADDLADIVKELGLHEKRHK